MPLYVGTSGYVYRHWRGLFYPEDLPSHKWLQFYADHFNTVEINATFYRIPKSSTVKGWLRRVPKEFLFTVKANRLITHQKKLKGVEEALIKFFTAVAPVQQRCGCVLYQLPPSLRRDDALLSDFCALLKERYPNWRHAVEFRNNSWLCDAVFDILRRHNVCYVLVSGRGQEFREIATADFLYLRFHGVTRWYDYNYSDEELREWAECARRLGAPRIPTFAYFNNDSNAYATKNATRFMELLNG